MKQYTNEQLDSLVIKLGKYVEQNYTELTSTKHCSLRSGIAIIYNAAARGSKLLNKTAQAYGVEVTGWHATLDKIVEATEARGSKAADTIKVTTAKTKALDKVFAANDVKGGVAKVLFVKKHKLH